MKNLKILFVLISVVFSLAKAQTIVVLNKNELYKPPLEQMVAMDKYTFGKYNYISQKYDTLKTELHDLDSIVKQRDSTQCALTQNYEYDLQVKDLEINTYKSGYSSALVELSNSITKNSQLQLNYQKLEDKSRRAKKWRNIFLGTALISTTFLILIVAH